jgi:uncharacterized membrane protein (DUF4010 family)
MDTIELFQRLSLALAIGLLIGLERGWQARRESDGERSAGLRTLALVALLGGICGALSTTLADGAGIWLGLSFLVTGGTIVLFRYRETGVEGTLGATTAVAGLLVFVLGAFALVGDKAAAAAAGVAVAGLLALKGALHAIVRRLTWPELRSVLMLSAMSVILLPVLPRHPIDPLGAINPFEIWLLTVMIGLISFAGYVAIKLTGAERGIALTGLAGGLASSTAATLTLARLARGHPERSGLMAGGVLLAGAIMMLRVAAIAAAVKPSLLSLLLPPLVVAAAVTIIVAALLLLRGSPEGSNGEDTEIAIVNPLDLGAVLKFGALLTAIGVVAHIATRFAGSAGAYLLAALSGIADVDAITLSMARLAQEGFDAGVAARAILIATALNTMSKVVIGWMAGGSGLGKRVAVVSVAAILAGLGAYALGPIPVEEMLDKLKTP